MTIGHCGMLLAFSVASGASSHSCDSGGGGDAPYAMTRQALVGLAAAPNLVTRSQDLVLQCTGDTGGGDALPHCSALQLSDSGSLVPTGLTDLLGVQRLPLGQILALGRDGTLTAGPALGPRRTVTSGLYEPSVLDDGARVIGVAHDGDTVRLVRVDIQSGVMTELLDDDGLLVAFPAPADGVLFASVRDGLPSLYLRDAAGTVRRVTNLGGGPKGKTPLPVWDPIWIDGGNRIVFAASDDSLWMVTVATGATRRVGRGRLPTLGPDGQVWVALGDGKLLPTVVELAPEVLQ